MISPIDLDELKQIDQSVPRRLHNGLAMKKEWWDSMARLRAVLPELIAKIEQLRAQLAKLEE